MVAISAAAHSVGIFVMGVPTCGRSRGLSRHQTSLMHNHRRKLGGCLSWWRALLSNFSIRFLNSLTYHPILLALLESRSFDEGLRFMVYQRADDAGFYCSFWDIWCNDNTPIHDTWNPPIGLYGWMLHKCVLQKVCNRHFLTMNWCLYGEQKQCIVPEEEWSTFISTLKKPLPTTFRINGRYAVLIMCIWNQISTIS